MQIQEASVLEEKLAGCAMTGLHVSKVNVLYGAIIPQILNLSINMVLNPLIL